MSSFLRRLRQRFTRRRAVPSVLTHEEALRLLVDYHFNRLSAEASSRVEDHIRSCKACQRAGLGHARTQRHQALRQLTSVRPARRRLPRVSRRALVIAGILCVGGATVLGALTNRLPSTAQLLPGQGGTGDQTPAAVFTAHLTMALSTAGATAVAPDPSGRTIAVAGSNGGVSGITLWRLTNGQASLLRTLTWPSKGVPSSITWSPNGTSLAASDGSIVLTWDTGASAARWVRNAPSATPSSVFSYADGALASAPNLTALLTKNAFMQWAADGQLAPALAGAAEPLGVALTNGPLVGAWRARGTYFTLRGADTVAGPGAEPAQALHAALDWSPDGHFLLYSVGSQPIAMPEDAGPDEEAGAPPPDEILVRVLLHIGSAHHGDGLAWFSEDGKHLAVCERTASAAPLQVYDLDSSRLAAALPRACDGLAVTSVAWLPHANNLLIALPGQPVRVYSAS